MHEVTPYLCRTDARGPHLSAGVVTALFDEVGMWWMLNNLCLWRRARLSLP